MTRRAMAVRLLPVFLGAAIVACAPEEKASPRPRQAKPAAEQPEGPPPERAGGGVDSMIVATVGVISHQRDAAAIKTLARDAFIAADVNKDLRLAPDEFFAALDYADAREAVGGVLGDGPTIPGRRDGSRMTAFEGAGRNGTFVSRAEFEAFFEMKQIAADRDLDGRLDDAEYATFSTLINGANGSG